VGELDMRHAMTTLMLGVIAVLSVLLAWVLLTPVPTTEELDADLKQVRTEIKQASSEADKYAPSLMKSLIELRRYTLANTEAMLSQKRASVLRRIILSYRFDGQQLTPASGKELMEIIGEIEQAESKVAQAKKHAEQYSGGLVQALALMSVETDQISVSQLRLKFYAAKYGLPIFSLPNEKKVGEPPGQIVRDKDAL
jgi:hypothetical protein